MATGVPKRGPRARGASPLPGGAPAAVRAAVRRRREQALGRRRRRRRALLWSCAAVLVAVFCFSGGLLTAPIDFTAPPPPKAALLLDAQGRVFAALRSPEQREDVPLAQIPAVMRQAVISAEDRTFYEHRGVDPLAVIRAAVRDLSGSHLQGGSTLTQQYVKNVYVGTERTAMRKLREAALAVRLERELSKDEILTRYLNAVYFGNGTYGVQAAARYYFGVPVKDLDLDLRTHLRSPGLALSRAALLAGIIPAPSAWNPVKDPASARTRQLLVLNRMVADGKITPGQASDAYGTAAPRIVAKSPDAGVPTLAPEFRDLVKAELDKQFAGDEDLLFRGGLRVTTTLDLDWQKAVVEAVRSVLPSPDDPEAAVVAVDPRNGDIRALTTRFVTAKVRGYRDGGFDLATDLTRSSGSTIKPFTLAAALETGHSLDETRYGPPCISIPNPGGTPDPYRPCNAGDGESGTFSLASALVHSVNTVYAPLAKDVGLAKVMQLAGDSGLAPRENLKTNLANSLGVEVTPLSMAVAYGTLVDHGVRHDPRSVLAVRAGGSGGTDTGELLSQAPSRPAGHRAMPGPVADAVTAVLQDVVERGTATAARQPFPVFGKTGTTNNTTNAWFVGCTRELCIATWMGYDRQYLAPDKPHAMVGVEGVGQVYGGTLPAKIFATAMENYRRLTNPAAPPAPATTTSAPRPGRTAPKAVPTTPQPTSTAASPVPTFRSPLPGPSTSPLPSPLPTVTEPTTAPTPPSAGPAG